MSNRPDITLALDVRSYERVVVISNPDSVYDYPEEWVRPNGLADAQVDTETVVIVDRIEMSRRGLSTIAAAGPRLMAFATTNVDQEKSVRRLIKSLYPWAEVWDVSTSFGKLLVSKDIRGIAYDRDVILDMRVAS